MGGKIPRSGELVELLVRQQRRERVRVNLASAPPEVPLGTRVRRSLPAVLAQDGLQHVRVGECLGVVIICEADSAIRIGSQGPLLPRALEALPSFTPKEEDIREYIR